MSVIIRLQNLPWSANALDIRQFFSGLSIPEGGVHIVGGEQGDAFIAFSTDEDARQAFNLNGGRIKEIQIKLMLSSRTEMQKIIEAARNPLAAFMHQNATAQSMQAILPAVIPPLMPEVGRKDDPKDKGKRDRRRSRSRSRDRKDRSRERDRRDRRRRDRSRSRSRERRERRRKDRSTSRERRPSKDRDRRSKDRRRSEEKSGFSSNSNSDKEPNAKMWEEPPTVNILHQQQQTLLNPFLANNLEENRRNLNALASSSLLLQGNRNGFQNRNDTFGGNRNQDNWNSMGQSMHPMGNRPNFHGHVDRLNEPFQSVNRPMQNQFGDNQGVGFNRLPSRRPENRASRFDSGLSPMLSDRPSLLDLPRPDYNKNCCVSLRPYYGGYGEIRRFFHGIFIHNTGIKFVNDENGKRTGIIHIQFAQPDGKIEALQRNGLILKNNRMEIAHLDDSIFESTVDRYRPEFKSDSNDRRSSPDQYRAKSSPIMFKSSVPSNFSCIAVEDLPLFTKEQDMLKIFSDYSMLSCWLVNQQRHVVAFIKFANADDAKKAITEKGKYTFDGKPLDIRPCSDEEYASVSQDEVQVIDDDDEDKDIEIDKVYMRSDCVSLTGLPLKTSDRDISDFFSDVAIVPTNIHLVNSSVGFTGEAFCEFASAADAEIALEKNGLPLGSGTVAVDSVLRADMEDTLRGTSGLNLNCNGPRPMFNRGFGGNFGPRGPNSMGPRPPMRRPLPTPVNPSNMGSKGCTLLMENVPYKAGLNEILEFFDGFNVPPDNVLRRYNENGTPSGEAKVIFTNPQDAFQALQERHHKKIRDRPIYLSQC